MRTAWRATVVLWVFGSLLGEASALLAAERAIKHSDVVFMGPGSKDVCEIYGTTVISWGGRPWGDVPKAIEEFRKRVEMAHSLGIRYCAGAAFRTDFAGMIDFNSQWRDCRCLSIDGQPITVPWLWDHKHKDGHPAYWFCSNAQGYRDFLKWQVKMGMTAEVEGLHIDDYNGTAGTEYLGACFCPNCTRAFAEFLKTKVAPQRLKECGVASLDGFDYGAYLKGRGIATVSDFNRVIFGPPTNLGPEYLRFQYTRAAEFVGDVRTYAEQIVGHPLLLSVNASVSDPKSLFIAPYVSYYCGEVNHGGEERPWGPKANRDLEPVWSFKLADAIGRFQACTGSGGDWAYIDAQKKPGLVRMWIAQDYAFGHALMAPVRQWAYTKEKGTHWYQARPEDYAHLYRFVRRNSTLFDDYEAVGLVGLLYSNAGARRSVNEVREACLWLAGKSIPFELALAGDDWLDARITPKTLGKYRAVVVAEPTLLEGEQKRTLDELAAAGRVVKYDAKTGLDEAALSRLAPTLIAIDGADKVIAVARANPARPDAPTIVHLLNRDYDPPADAMKKLKNVKVTLHKDLFGGRSFTKATLYCPPAVLDRQDPGASEPVSLRIEPAGNDVTVAIPKLELWGVVKLE